MLRRLKALLSPRRQAPAVVALCLGLAAGAPLAHAQSNPLGAKPLSDTIIRDIDIGDLATLLASEGLGAREIVDPNGIRLIEVTVPGSGSFYVVPLACADEANKKGCTLVQPFANLGGSRSSYQSVNDFNRDRTRLGTMMIAPTGSVLAATKIFLGGGVTTDHVVGSVALLVMDIDNYIGSLSADLVNADPLDDDNLKVAVSFPSLLPDAVAQFASTATEFKGLGDAQWRDRFDAWALPLTSE